MVRLKFNQFEHYVMFFQAPVSMEGLAAGLYDHAKDDKTCPAKHQMSLAEAMMKPVEHTLRHNYKQLCIILMNNGTI